MLVSGQEVKCDGVLVKIGERDFIVPPLSLGQLKRLRADIMKARESADENRTGYDRMLDTLPIIHAALSRNYPDMTITELEDIVDLGNYSAVVDAVFAVSGLMKEMRDKLGEALAVTRTNEDVQSPTSTGAESTQG
jgi:hypothetical protein